MNTLKSIAFLLALGAGHTLWAASCDSTVWYEKFDLLQVQGVHRLDTEVRPSTFPFAEVCFEGGYPRSIYVNLGNGLVLGGRYGFSASRMSIYRDSLGRDAYLHVNLYPGDSIISLQFIKRWKPGGSRWRLNYKSVTYQTESIWIGPSLDRKIQAYNVRRLMAHPQKLLSLVPDTLGKEYFKSVRKFVCASAGKYAIESSACYIEGDDQKPMQRQQTITFGRACYEMGEGVDCANLGPWLLEGVREDSVRCTE